LSYSARVGRVPLGRSERTGKRMRSKRRATIQDLRQAVGCLPRATRVAMLEGIANNVIIAGAYANRDGICPLLAAHRAGARTASIAFARAWDRFAFRDARIGRPRRATDRELLVLTAQLEASLLVDGGKLPSLGAAIAEHRELAARVEKRPDRAHPPTGDRDRTAELRARPGWAWTRVVRRYDDYQQTLAQLRKADAPSGERSGAPRSS
jgi:hypothetical protein